MKREPMRKKQGDRRLVLRRDTVRALDDDALHQARGGAGWAASGVLFQEANNY